MYRLLIAEDERLERDALLELVRRCPRVGEVRAVENGRQAVEAAEGYRPDICLLDIKMPGLDGMEAAREIRSRNTSVQIIFLTALDQFDYARQALRLRASEFLVKPAEDSEVVDAVGRAAETLDGMEVAADSRDELARRIEILTPIAESQLCEGVLSGDEVALHRLSELLGSRTEVRALILRMRRSAREELSPVAGRQEGRRRRVRSLLLSVARGCGYAGIASSQSPELRLLFLPREEGESGELKRALRESLDEFARRELVCPRALLTDLTASSTELSDWATRASLALDRNLASEGLHSLRRISGVTEQIRQEYQLERELLLSIQRDDGTVVRYAGERLFQFGSSRKQLAERLAYLAHALRLPGVELPELSEGESLRESFLSALEELRRRHREAGRGGSSPAVERVQEYVDRHYMEELSLDLLADVAGISPFHLSRLFKGEVGKTVGGYITERRLSVARELLCQGRLSVKEVSAKTGFADPSYFSRVFLRREGVAPSDFRRRVVTP
ncbi:MAG: response regulator [Alkalispirochaetaceae bacterium]